MDELKSKGAGSPDRVDPELRHMLTSLPPLALSLDTLPRIRAERELFWARFNDGTNGEGLGGIVASEQRISGAPGTPAVRILTYRPVSPACPMPGYMQIHGGGFVLNSADSCDLANRELAATLGCFVVSVDYRLAPETRAPGAVEDCYAVLEWLYDHAEQIGIDPVRIAVGGESAGGGIAAALALLARDRGRIPICFQDLTYPMLDDRTARIGGDGPLDRYYVWTREHNYFGWKALLGFDPGAAGVSYYAAPARATNLSGLPAALIQVGELDLFLEEDLDYGSRLLRCGVQTEVHVYPRAFHGFNRERAAQVSQAMHRDRLNALRRAFE